jgi:hypothetical protein
MPGANAYSEFSEDLMRTQLMIMLIVSAVFLFAVAWFVGLVLWLDWLGAGAVGLGIVIAAYVWVVKPWHMRWGGHGRRSCPVHGW